MGSSFKEFYINLLRETGTMTAEDLVLKHLKEDIREPKFWQESLNVVDKLVTRFEKLV